MQKKSKKNHSGDSGAFRFGDFDLFPLERQLLRRQKPVRVQPKAFDALLLFVQNAERLVRRDTLVETLWPDTYVTDANLTNVIVALRKILGRDAIQTVSKFGYRLTRPVLAEPGIQQPVYATFLRAKELMALRSLDSMTQARDLLSLCVADDPSFATAWAWLGRCCLFLEKFKDEPSANLELAQAALRRALAIDPHLACANHFYTQLQVNLGHSRDAMVRLARRLSQRGGEPESFAGLVQALRHCGLLDESVAAHARATELDPTIVTSVTHTHFVRCDYQASLDTYTGTRYYLDAAAWAALGEPVRAKTLLRERLAGKPLSRLMSGMMRSLLATLDDRRDEAVRLTATMAVEREPEILFYLARHLAMLDAEDDCLRLLARAREEGFTASAALERDAVFERLRGRGQFRREIRRARTAEQAARLALAEAGGPLLQS